MHRSLQGDAPPVVGNAVRAALATSILAPLKRVQVRRIGRVADAADRHEAGSASFKRRATGAVHNAFSPNLARRILACEVRSCCRPAAKTIKAWSPSLATRPLTCYFVVAGAGFEPATSGL